MNNLKKVAIDSLNERGITIDSMASIVYELQKEYNDITLEYCKDTVLSTLDKDEVINAVLTGIAIDKATEQHLFDPEINDIIIEDSKLYGIDEILALSIVNIYGSIALTNFGYLDKLKPHIIGEIDKLGKEKKRCNTFLDDIVAAIISAALSKIAHNNAQKEN